MWNKKLSSYDRQFFEWYLRYKCDKESELRGSFKDFEEYENYMDAMANRFPVEWSTWKLCYKELEEEKNNSHKRRIKC